MEYQRTMFLLSWDRQTDRQCHRQVVIDIHNKTPVAGFEPAYVQLRYYNLED